MIEPTALKPLKKPGVASAENGLVMLDGPDGIAVTMTPDAATGTGQSLLSAADEARAQVPTEREDEDGMN